MKGVGVSSLLVILGFVLIAADDELDESKLDGKVSFSGTTVSLECPFNSEVKWFKVESKKEKQTKEKVLDVENYSSNDNGWYYCNKTIPGEVKNKRFHFFIKAKVCAKCYNLDMALVVGCLFGDVLITLAIVLVVYLCSRSKTGPAPPQRATHTRQTGAPPPPDPDYQPLNQATRSHDVYSEAKRRY